MRLLSSILGKLPVGYVVGLLILDKSFIKNHCQVMVIIILGIFKATPLCIWLASVVKSHLLKPFYVWVPIP